MQPIWAATAVMLIPTIAAAQEPAYRDDRSTPTAVIESLYNAIDRHEYLRAWSYFDGAHVDDYETFKAGYATTQRVVVRVGAPRSEGAAGTIYTHLPTVIAATRDDGTVAVFAGCYVVAAVNAAIQDTPPFVPMRIVDGTLTPSDASFDTATGHCAD